MRIPLILVLWTASLSVEAQKKIDPVLLNSLKSHVSVLSHDSMQGRRTGTEGEWKAAQYIQAQFQSIGLLPWGEKGYFQPFEIYEGKEILPSTSLTIDKTRLTLSKDYFPLSSSPDIQLEALPSASLQEPGMPWFFDLDNLKEEASNNPHYDIEGRIRKLAEESHKKGASSIFIYNSGSWNDGLKFDPADRSDALPVPVIYLQKHVAAKYLKDESATLDIRLISAIGPRTRKTRNVLGYIDNGAPGTIIIGAHYDHIGMGEDGNSRETKKEIHNGADDNASGVAGLIEIARILKAQKSKTHNYLFAAFSGEELGLYGSKFLTQVQPKPIGKTYYMINMDMIGRLSPSSKTLTVGGYGTTPLWGSLYGKTKKKEKLYAEDLSFKFDSSGTGPSDHTSFYRKNIPVLFYFTGLHEDYHKPGDDAAKINFEGQARIINHIVSLIQATGKTKDAPLFTATREAQVSTSARFSVSLGIMPDYSFSGKGVRADGVIENRAAQKAGIQAGDIIIKIGDRDIDNLESYMQALASFKKGDSTTVIYLRKEQQLTAPVQF